MARKKPGAYAPLAANYADDDKIMAAGEEAELCYIRILAYCARTPKTEGHITHAQVRTRLGLDGAETRAETCADTGLLTRTHSGYVVTNWLKWNQSWEEINRYRAQDLARKGGTENAVTSDDDGNGTGNGTGTPRGKNAGVRAPDTDSDSDSLNTRKRQLADDWKPNSTHDRFSIENSLNIAQEADHFRDHHRARGTAFKDWDAAFRTWLRNAVKFRQGATVTPIAAGGHDPNWHLK